MHHMSKIYAYKAVDGCIGLILDATALRLSVLDGGIDQAAVSSLSSSGQDQGRVGCSILEQI